MNIGTIFDRVWKTLADTKGNGSKKFWPADELAIIATNVEADIAERLHCLLESDTIGYIRLSGTAGQVSSVSVSGVTITSGVVTYTTSLANTASLLAANIRNHTSTPNYRAISRDDLVIIKAVPGSFPAAGYSIAATVSGGMAAAVTDLPGLCRIAVAANDQYLMMHEKVVEFDRRLRMVDHESNLTLKTKEQMDALSSGWETSTANTPAYAIPDYDTKELVLSCPMDTADMIETTVFRKPLFEFSESKLTQIPEIPLEYHPIIVTGMVKECLLKNDVETYDLKQGMKYEAEYLDAIDKAKQLRIRQYIGSKTNQVPGGLL